MNSIPLTGLWLCKTACYKAVERRFRQSDPFQGLSKRKLGRALLSYPYATARGGQSILRGYFHGT